MITRITACAAIIAANLILFTGCERSSQPPQANEPQSLSPTSASIQMPAATTAPAASGDMASISAGRFQMGDKDQVDAKLHEVAVSAFLIDKTLVTQEQYEKIIGENPSRWKAPKNPVEQVRWSDAVKLARPPNTFPQATAWPSTSLSVRTCRVRVIGPAADPPGR